MSKYAVGIDFGTTNSLISLFSPEKGFDFITTESGDKLIPSVVHFKNEREVIVGSNAKAVELIEPQKTFSHIKRKIGRNEKVTIDNNEFEFEELAALIFKKLKKLYSEYTNEDSFSAVITVPAYFDHLQREGVRAAAEAVGIKVIKLLNEPTAAAIYYNNISSHIGKKMLVFDFGGGTLDISILQMDKEFCEVITSGGSTEIGGMDFDQLLAEYFARQFYQTYNIDLKQDPIAYQQLLFQSEKAKKEISQYKEVNIVVPYITVTPQGPLHFKHVLSRSEFEKLTYPLLEKIKKILQYVLESNNLTISQIDDVLLVGGASRLYLVKQLVSEYFKKETRKDVNPEEAIAAGAALHAAMLMDMLKNKKFYDVTTHNLGIEDDKGNFEIIIPKNKRYPLTESRIFTTSQDNMQEIRIHVLQDRAESILNISSSVKEKPLSFVSLGEFTFPISGGKKAGEPNIEISFAIDESSIIHVQALDLDSGEVRMFHLHKRLSKRKIDKITVY